MNSLIKELAVRAGTPLIHDRFMTASQEKFAVLIITECISACVSDRLGKTVGAEALINARFGIE